MEEVARASSFVFYDTKGPSSADCFDAGHPINGVKVRVVLYFR
jgi:hypothetical protein